jgi:hypothetical protein
MKNDVEKLLHGPLGKKLRSLETTRLNIIRKRTSLWPWTVFFACLSVFSFLSQEQREPTGYVFVCALLPLITAGTLRRMKSYLAWDFKRETIPALLSITSPWYVWSPKRSISIEEFKDSILYVIPDRLSGYDYIEGVHGVTHFRFSYVHAEEKQTVHELDIHGHSRMRDEYYTIFSGIFLSAHCDNKFQGRTLVVPSSHFPERISGQGTFVKLRDPAFNEKFIVTSCDQMEARRLLTPPMMDRLLALRKNFGEYRMSFSDGRVRVAILRCQNLLEPDIEKPFDRAQVTDIHSRLMSIVGIIDNLSLNTQIRKIGHFPKSETTKRVRLTQSTAATCNP